jgi:uncharacterized damage-inducible protein DinB
MFSNSQLYRLKHQHETIAELVSGLTKEQLRMPVNPGKWSAQQNIAHLAAYQPVFLARMMRIQKEQSPSFERYVADNDPPFLEASQKNVPDLLEQIRVQRQSIVDMLLSLDETALRRTAIHPRYGNMDVSRWVEFFLLHEAHHLYTIFMLAADLRTSLHLQIS